MFVGTLNQNIKSDTHTCHATHTPSSPLSPSLPLTPIIKTHTWRCINPDKNQALWSCSHTHPCLPRLTFLIKTHLKFQIRGRLSVTTDLHTFHTPTHPLLGHNDIQEGCIHGEWIESLGGSGLLIFHDQMARANTEARRVRKQAADRPSPPIKAAGQHSDKHHSSPVTVLRTVHSSQGILHHF